MSYSSHRHATLDESLPLANRASHARSCAIHVANKLGVKRDAVIASIAASTGVSLHQPGSGTELNIAMAAMDVLRTTALAG